MVSRRFLLSGTAVVVTGAGLGTVVATDRLDDGLRALGARPTPLPDPGDLRLTTAARRDADALVALARSSDTPAAVLTALEQQQAALPPAASASTDQLAGDLRTACTTAADARAAAATTAVATELTQVLASMAAGLDQCARALETR